MNNIISVNSEEQSLKIQIQNKCSLPLKIVLLLILIPCALLPIAGIVIAASRGVLSFGVIIGASAYTILLLYPFFKITVWQLYGQEIFLIYKDKVTYEACFKFLKSQFDEIKINQLEILFSDRELKKEDKVGTLIFLSENNKLKSVLKINEEAYQQILEKYKINVQMCQFTNVLK